jgi:hypothetical protein
MPSRETWSFGPGNNYAYEATIAQSVTGVTDGTYTLSAWIQSSGGQAVAQLFAKDFGETEKDVSVNTSIASWAQVSVPGITVTNGTCQIGVKTTASANQLVEVDDFTLIKN